MPEPVSAKPVPKLRAKSANKPPRRPRPKTIHAVKNDTEVLCIYYVYSSC